MTDDTLRRLADLCTATADLIGVCKALLWLNPTLPARAVQHVQDAIATAQRAKDAA